MKKGSLFVMGIFLVSALAMRAQAAVSFEASAPESVKAGDNVKVTVTIAGNTGLSTSGLRIVYDPTLLTYQSASWSPEINAVGSMLKLASDVAYEGKRAVNISFVDSSGYSGNGEIITVNFTALKDYTGEVVSLGFREASAPDGGEVQADAKTVSSGSGVPQAAAGSGTSASTQPSSPTTPSAGEASNGSDASNANTGTSTGNNTSNANNGTSMRAVLGASADSGTSTPAASTSTGSSASNANNAASMRAVIGASADSGTSTSSQSALPIAPTGGASGDGSGTVEAVTPSQTAAPEGETGAEPSGETGGAEVTGTFIPNNETLSDNGYDQTYSTGEGFDPVWLYGAGLMASILMIVFGFYKVGGKSA